MSPTARAQLVSIARAETENPTGNNVSLNRILGEIRKTTGSCVQVLIIVITLPSDHSGCSPYTILLVHIKGARAW